MAADRAGDRPGRANGRAIRSRPGTLLLVSTLIVIGITLLLPYVPFNFLFGFIPLSTPLMLTMLRLTALCMLVTEIAKRFSTRRWKMQLRDTFGCRSFIPDGPNQGFS